MKRFALLLLLWPAFAWADAPKVEPGKVEVEARELFQFRVTPEKGKKLVAGTLPADKFVVFQAIDGSFAAQARKGVTGTFTLQFWHEGDTVKLPSAAPLPELPVATLTVVVGGEQPKPPEPKDPPKEPTQPTGLYFMLVRADGAADPAFTRIVRDFAWSKLKDAGHKVKDFGVSDLNRLGVVLPSGSPLPCVVTLYDDGRTSRIVRGPITLPSDSQSILDLPKGVSP